MKNEIRKYLIFSLLLFCMPLLTDVSAKTNILHLRLSGNYHNASGAVVSSFDFYDATQVPSGVFPVINGFTPYFDGIPPEYELNANKTTYLHFRFGTNVGIDETKLGKFLDGIVLYHEMGSHVDLKLVHSDITITKPVIEFDFYVRYTCPSSSYNCRIGNSNLSFLNSNLGKFTDNPYYYIYSGGDRYFGTTLNKSYVEVVSELDVNTAISSSNNKVVIDGLDRVESSINKVDGTLNDIKDMDIPEDKKQLPDDSTLKDYENVEGELLDKIGEADLSNVNIGIDAKSSSFVWDTTTKFIKAHPTVFGMFISMLSIGIIKLALGR